MNTGEQAFLGLLGQACEDASPSALGREEEAENVRGGEEAVSWTPGSTVWLSLPTPLPGRAFLPVPLLGVAAASNKAAEVSLPFAIWVSLQPACLPT